jgi:hypothetical protein
MALKFIAGKYDVTTGTYAAGPTLTSPTTIGQTDGVVLEYASVEEDIRGDNLGQSLQDNVYRGGNCFLDLNLLQTDSTRQVYLAGTHTVEYGTDGAEEPLGTTDGGIELEWTMHAQMFSGDNLGGSIQDGVYRGADVTVQMTLLQVNPHGVADAYETWKALWPWADDHATPDNQMLQLGRIGKAGAGLDPVGRLASSNGVAGDKSLKLTGVTGTPVAGEVFDFHDAKLAAGYPIRLLMRPELRRIPIRFQVYPDTTKWFTYTAGPTLPNFLWPWNATWGNVGTIGVLLSTLATGIKLVALAGTPAATNTAPLQIVAKSAILAPGYPVRVTLAPLLRRVQVRLQLLPYATAGDANLYAHYEPLAAAP